MSTRCLVSTPAGSALEWQAWDDIYIVYQPSSAETHVFNETTALILRCLQHGPQSMEFVAESTEAALGAGAGELGSEDLAFAVERLEELGLVEDSDVAIAVQ